MHTKDNKQTDANGLELRVNDSSGMSFVV